VQAYWDTDSHKIEDPRRGNETICNGTTGVPTHDVSARLEGPGVAGLNDVFQLHWNRFAAAGAPVLSPAPVPGAAASPGTSLQIVRTLPGSRFSTIPQGETGIFEAYSRAFSQVQQFIYLENQYFNSRDSWNASSPRSSKSRT